MVSEQRSALTGVARRERQRARVLTEIKEAARAELRERGSAGVTMRAVARAIDITPSGLYRYVDGHEALLGLLASDALGDLADRIEAAQDMVCDPTHAARWFAGCVAMRLWSLEHPAEYGLIFDTRPTRGQPRTAAQSGNRAIGALSGVLAGALADGEIDSDRTLLGELRATAEQDLPEAADLLTATGVACLVGHLTIEVGGRIASPLSSEERYAVFVRAVMRLLGFTPDARARVAPDLR